MLSSYYLDKFNMTEELNTGAMLIFVQASSYLNSPLTVLINGFFSSNFAASIILAEAGNLDFTKQIIPLY